MSDIAAMVLHRPTRQDREVYFLQAVTLKLIKIGVADNAEKRCRDLAMSSPDRLAVLGVMICRQFGRTEGLLHERFKRRRRHGEWFEATPDLLDYIEAFATTNTGRISRLQRACDDPKKAKGRKPRTHRHERLRNGGCKTVGKTFRGDEG